MDSTTANPEDLEIKQLLNALGSEDGMERKKARKKLVAKGTDMIDYLMELVHHPKHIYRWEALKTMEEIRDVSCIPLFIEALEDDESDIRWIAAEGLIKLGIQSIRPILKALVEKPASTFTLAGAHHVFYDLKKSNELPKDFPVDKLLSVLKGPGWGGSVKPTAYELLK